MSESQVNTKQRSTNNTVTRLSYDCLMSATKSFVHNFASLTEDEKQEYKSLATYVKQLERCLPNKSGSVVQRKKVVSPVVPDSVPVSVSVEETVSEPVKKSRKKPKVEQVVQVTDTPLNVVSPEVKAEVKAEVQVESKAKRGSKK
jgi:hypothetical protein